MNATSTDASIVITTRNRGPLLVDAVRSCLEQSARVEVLIMDDASTDGSVRAVQEAFPAVRVVRSETRIGLIAQRNRAAELASSPIIFSIDDDAVFTSADTVEQVLRLFDTETVGAASIPVINRVNGKDSRPFAEAPDGSTTWVTSVYIGTAHAVRREVFLGLGGYREYLFHWGEESNYCCRLLNAGYVVALANCPPIIHRPAQEGRHSHARNVYILRNRILNAWYNAPGRYLLLEVVLHTGATVVRSIRTRHFPRSLYTALVSLGRGLWGCVHEWNRRDPVPVDCYRLYRSLHRRRAVPLSEVAPVIERNRGGVPRSGRDGRMGVGH